MGEVYLCLDEQTVHPYALKTFQSSTPQLRAIFEAESQPLGGARKAPEHRAVLLDGALR